MNAVQLLSSAPFATLLALGATCRVQAHLDDATELESWLQGYLRMAVDAVVRTEAVQERDASTTILTIYGSRHREASYRRDACTPPA